MKHVKLLENFEAVNEKVVTINDITDLFEEFYKKLNEYAPQLDDETKEHLREAIPFLDAAWKEECAVHGVRYSKTRIKNLEPYEHTGFGDDGPMMQRKTKDGKKPSLLKRR